MARFPLLGVDNGPDIEVFEVYKVLPTASSIPLPALQCLAPNIPTTEVHYLCANLPSPFIRLYLHPCVFSTISHLNTFPVSAGIFFHQNHFSDRVIEVTSDDLGKNRLGNRFYISLEQVDQGNTWKFARDSAEIRINTGISVVIFSSLVVFDWADTQYQYLTRHVLLLAPLSPLGNSILMADDYKGFHAVLMGLQEKIVHSNAFYAYKEYFMEEITGKLIGLPVSEKGKSLFRELVYLLTWEIDGKPGHKPEYGRNTYEDLCKDQAETEGSEGGRLRITSIWTKAIRLVQEYYLLSYTCVCMCAQTLYIVVKHVHVPASPRSGALRPSCQRPAARPVRFASVPRRVPALQLAYRLPRHHEKRQPQSRQGTGSSGVY